MLVDIAIDTNVLMHAIDPRQKLQDVTVKLLNKILDSSAKLCVDEGAFLDGAKNKSQIMSEYLAHLTPGSFSRTFLARIAATDRLVERKKKVDAATAKFINVRIADKGCDRVFIKVALNSEARLLASHDFSDITRKVRKEFRKEFDLGIGDAAELLAMF